MTKLAVWVPDERFDERDAMFSRAALVAGTSAYEAAYARRPELKETDDALRALPELTQPGGSFFDPPVMANAKAHFQAIDELNVDEAWLQRKLHELESTQDPSAFLKRAALELGAIAAGWAPLPGAFIYSHKGRFPEAFGRKVDLEHPRALVFLVEMDFGEMQEAPQAPTLRQSALQYFRAARISLHLEALIRAAGFQAKQHFDAHYDVILPPLAVLAGLGEVGRNNILIADRVGSRVRIGCVTTDLPAVLDEPQSLGVEAFCKVCRKCAGNCPSRALSLGDKVQVRGAPKWVTNVERCYRYWRVVGTDCGVCMVCCPFSHRDTPVHNLVRWLVRHVPVLNRVLVQGDALLYGRQWRHGHGTKLVDRL